MCSSLWDKLTVLGSNRAVLKSLRLDFYRGRGGRSRVLYWRWPCIFGNTAVAGGGQRLTSSLTKPRPVELLWWPYVRGRCLFRCIQRPKTRTQDRGLEEWEKQNKNWTHRYQCLGTLTHVSVCWCLHMIRFIYALLSLPVQHVRRWYQQMRHGHSCWLWRVRSCVLQFVHCGGNW